jgi:hypothetical protein
MFTPIGFFAPQGGLPNIVTDGLQIWADPNHSLVTYTSGVIAGTIQNLAETAYTISFGNVTATPYDSSPISFSVGTSGGKNYFLPNGSNPFANDASTNQGFVNIANAFTAELWFYWPTSTTNPYYYNFGGTPYAVTYRFPSQTPRSLFLPIFQQWSDATNRYKFLELFVRNDANVVGSIGSYPLGATQWNDGQWHLWTTTSTGGGGTIKTYVDGIDQSINITQPAGVYSNTTVSYMGHSGGGDYRVWQGGARGGSFRWYNKALSAAEVLQNYNAELNTFGA